MKGRGLSEAGKCMFYVLFSLCLFLDFFIFIISYLFFFFFGKSAFAAARGRTARSHCKRL